jgi:hypothetical protein
MSLLTSLDRVFLEDPKRMDMGKGKLSSRYKVTEEEIEESRKKIRAITFCC